MNAEAERAAAARADEVKRAGGLAAFRAAALGRLRAKAVVRESHCSPVRALAFNHADPGCANLFATVGADQATVYDDDHLGGHLAVAAHLHNAPSAHAAGGGLAAAAWLPAAAPGWARHPHGDALLAVAGADPAISVISVAEAAVVRLLAGHAAEVVDLAAVASPGAPPAAARLLASLSKDGDVRVWDAPAGALLSSTPLPGAAALALAPRGDALVVGFARGGRLAAFPLDAATGALDAARGRDVAPRGGGHAEAVECVRFLGADGGRLASKSADGRMFVWDARAALAGLAAGGAGGSAPAPPPLASWKVPGCAGGGAVRGAFGATPDGAYVAAGNAAGDVFVFDAASGRRAAHVAPHRVCAPVAAVALSHDCAHVLAAVGKGFVFRFEAAPLGDGGGGAHDGGGGDDEKENADAAGEGEGE